jgi:hypothetical protein
MMAGVQEPILDNPCIQLPHLEGLHQINGAIEVDQPFAPVTQRQAANGSILFGWKCVLSDGTPIAEASGPTYGSKESSYQ